MSGVKASRWFDRERRSVISAAVGAITATGLAIGAIWLSVTAWIDASPENPLPRIRSFVSLDNVLLVLVAPAAGLAVAGYVVRSVTSMICVLPRARPIAGWAWRLWRPTVRFVGSLPTLVVGAVVVVGLGRIGFPRDSLVWTSMWISAVVFATTIPTALILLEGSDATERRDILITGRTLRLRRTYIADALIGPTLSRNVRAGMVFAIGRTLVEGMIVALRSDLPDVDSTFGPSQAQTLVEAVFSESILAQNYWLLLAIFAVAAGLNVWSSTTN